MPPLAGAATARAGARRRRACCSPGPKSAGMALSPQCVDRESRCGTRRTAAASARAGRTAAAAWSAIWANQRGSSSTSGAMPVSSAIPSRASRTSSWHSWRTRGQSCSAWKAIAAGTDRYGRRIVGGLALDLVDEQRRARVARPPAPADHHRLDQVLQLAARVQEAGALRALRAICGSCRRRSRHPGRAGRGRSGPARGRRRSRSRCRPPAPARSAARSAG